MKNKLLILLTLMTLILSACSGQTAAGQNTAVDAAASKAETLPAAYTPTTAATAPATATADAAAASDSAEKSSILNTTYDNALSVPLQLLWGTFKLFGTDQAITKDQAAQLVTLWSEYQSLTMSMGGGQPGGAPGAQPNNTDPAQAASTPMPQPTLSSETQTRIDELVKQIEAVMTVDQLKAIAALKITQETAQTMMQEQNISMGGPQQGDNTATTGQAAGNQPPQGGPGGAGGPGGQMGQPPSGTPPADMTPPAGGPGGQMGGGQMPGDTQPAGSMGGDMLPPGVIQALLKLLANTSENNSIIATVEAGAQQSGQPGGQNGAPGGQPGGASSSSANISGAYTVDGTSETKGGETYNATEQDQSAIYVKNGGLLTLSNATITTSGDTASQDNSSFYGQNAAVLAGANSTITLSDSTITTSGTGANGAFATGSGSNVSLTNVTIKATADGGHGVMATQGGTMTLNNVNIDTTGGSSSAIATDRGSGTINVTGGAVHTAGQNSAGIYSTGVINVSGTTFVSTGAEAAVIEGGNSITLTDASLSSSKEKWGVMIYQSMSGDAEGTKGTFTMTGGKLEYTPTAGPLFYVTNSTAIINLKAVTVTNGSNSLIQASAGNWGNKGTNGGTVVFTADTQSLTGNLVADSLSAISLTLQNGSSLEGAINIDKIARAINLTLDVSSTWNVTADSYLSSLSDSAGISGTTITNINGNGHTVTYDPSACPELGGQTYTLNGGGTLKPAN